MKASELLEQSAGPFDEACIMVKKMEDEVDAELAKDKELLKDVCDSVAVRTTGGLQGEWHRAMEYLDG